MKTHSVKVEAEEIHWDVPINPHPPAFVLKWLNSNSWEGEGRDTCKARMRERKDDAWATKHKIKLAVFPKVSSKYLWSEKHDSTRKGEWVKCCSLWPIETPWINGARGNDMSRGSACTLLSWFTARVCMRPCMTQSLAVSHELTDGIYMSSVVRMLNGSYWKVNTLRAGTSTQKKAKVENGLLFCLTWTSKLTGQSSWPVLAVWNWKLKHLKWQRQLCKQNSAHPHDETIYFVLLDKHPFFL